MNKLKVWIGIFLIFTLGTLTGVIGTRMYVKHRIEQFAGAKRPRIMHLLVRRLSRELDLTETQRAKIEKIMDQTQAKLRDLRSKYKPELESIITSSMESIKAELNEAQKRKMDEIYAKLQTHWRFRRHFHRPPPPRTAEEIFSELETRLKLSDREKTLVYPIIKESVKTRRKIFEKYREKRPVDIKSLRNEMQKHDQSVEKQLETIFTKQQMEEYLKMQEEERERRHRVRGLRRPGRF